MTSDDQPVEVENTETPSAQEPRSRIVRVGIPMLVVLSLVLGGMWLWERSEKASMQAANEAARGLAERLVEMRKADPHNGFDVSNASIPVEEIRRGGVPKDGIPALTEPKFVAAKDVDFLQASDKVIGVVHGDIVRAYPLRIIVWHEIVNDTLGDRALAITYCPLCGTSMVFERTYGDETFTFGVSGLLYQSDVLMYDRESDSLWSQLKMESVAGAHVGTPLTWLASELMTWAAWQAMHPESEVLSTDTGHNRNYERTAYAGYEQKGTTIFPVPRTRNELETMDWVVGIVVNGEAKAYPIKALELLGDTELPDQVGGEAIKVSYDAEKEWPRVTRVTGGEAVAHVNAYWFAWQAFYPETGLYAPQE